MYNSRELSSCRLRLHGNTYVLASTLPSMHAITTEIYRLYFHFWFRGLFSSFMCMDRWMEGWQVPSTFVVDMHAPFVWRLQDVDGDICANDLYRVAHGAQDITVNPARPCTALHCPAPSEHPLARLVAESRRP